MIIRALPSVPFALLLSLSYADGQAQPSGQIMILGQLNTKTQGGVQIDTNTQGGVQHHRESAGREMRRVTRFPARHMRGSGSQRLRR
jgi:hypothetical protein